METKALATLIIFIFVDFAFAQNTTVANSCKDVPLPEVQLLTNNTVCVQGPCIVRPGSDLVLTVIFKSPSYLEHIQFKVMASALGVHLDYNLHEDDACVGIRNTMCPLVTDEVVKYAHTMHLSDIFPEAAVSLMFTILDKDTDTDVLCFAIDIQLKKT